MQSSNIPARIPLPFAYAAGPSYKNTIPTASQIGITNGKASLTDGFPPLTFQALSAGGVPPFGADFNGILNEITAIQQWQNAGGMFTYDSTFATAVGGYPKGAILQSSSLNGLWISSAENNTTNPDTGGAGWVSLSFEGLQAVTVTSSDVTLTQLQSAYPVIVVSGAKTAARNLIFPAIVGEWIVQNNTIGSYTLTAKTASGTGVTLTQGESTYIYGDGTNIYFSDSAKVASFNGRTGTITLNALDVTSALGYVPVNPAEFIHSFTPGVTPVSSSGYQYLPDGLIMQWGTVTSSSSGGLTVNFPISFPNGIFGIMSNWNGGFGGASGGVTVNANNLTLSNFILVSFIGGTYGQATCVWLAYGY